MGLHATYVHHAAYGAADVVLVDGVAVGFAELEPGALGFDQGGLGCLVEVTGGDLFVEHLHHALVDGVEFCFYLLLLDGGALIDFDGVGRLAAIKGKGELAGAGQGDEAGDFVQEIAHGEPVGEGKRR